MAKRFFASEIWEEDWFLDMPNEYRWFWFYMLAKCDHAGIFRVNLKSIRGRIEGDLTPNRALILINSDKQRVRVLKENVWLIEDFFVFQYGQKFNINNKVHESIYKVYSKHEVDVNSIRGLTEVILTPKRPGLDPGHGAKDKDKDKEEGSLESRDKIGGMEEREGNWSQMPGPQFYGLELPAIKAGAAIQLVNITHSTNISQRHIDTLWDVFKKQHFTGKKYYGSPDEVYTHFINWSKTQKINGKTNWSGSQSPTAGGQDPTRIAREGLGSL